ncbi:MAG: DUF362 domain-containing protein [Fibrobacteres bacterium]|nr:DUF362 domain-containing protein [Fibrobacterota bacterium]
MNDFKCSRRGFMKAGTGAAVATTLVPGLISLSPSSAEAAVSPMNKWPGRVVVNYNNKHAATQTGGTAADKTILTKMVDDSIKMLTGETTVGAAWKAIFPATLNANSKIAIKINLLSSGVVPGHPYIVAAMVEGLMQMNFGTASSPVTLTRSNITIYDGNNSNAFSAKGYNATNFPGITLRPTDTLSSHGDGARGANYANTLYNAEFLINIPGIRGHSSYAGNATLGFKSHYGTYPTSYHDNITTPPYLRDINCLGPVFAKTVLTVGNAIYATNYGNGPSTNSNPDNYNRYAKTMDPSVVSTRVQCDTILMSTDPVAIEMQMHKIMSLNANPVRSYAVSNLPTYLKLSGGVAVGTETVYNIGTIDESQQNVGKIINEVAVGWTGQERLSPKSAIAVSSITVRPNPANPRTCFDYTFSHEHVGKPVHVEVFDSLGQCVFKEESVVAGIVNHFVWEGKDNSGQAAASGNYVVYIKAGKDQRKASFTLVR